MMEATCTGHSTPEKKQKGLFSYNNNNNNNSYI